MGFKPVPPPGLIHERVTTLPVPKTIIDAILTAGIQAPSGDNIQPWTFRFEGEKIHLDIHKIKDRSYFDYQKIPAFISSGTVLENIRIASTFYGLEAVIESVGVDTEHHVATIQFKLSDEPQDSLFNAIWERNTNRRLYLKKPIPLTITEKLKQSALSFPGVKWHEVNDTKSLHALAHAVLLADILRSERKDLHLHFQSMLRFNQKMCTKQRTASLCAT